MSDQIRTYGLKYKARCMCSQRGYTEKSRFFVGTMTLREENQVHLIQVEEDEIVCHNLFGHPSEVWCMTSSPDDPLLLFTSSQSLVDSSSYSFSPYKKTESSNPIDKLPSPYNVCLWRLEEDEFNSHLKPILSLHKSGSSQKGPLPSPTKQYHF